MDDGRITSLEQNRKNGSPANGLAPNSGALPLAEVELRASPATGD
jgi:hypothetical protein